MTSCYYCGHTASEHDADTGFCNSCGCSVFVLEELAKERRTDDAESAT